MKIYYYQKLLILLYSTLCFYCNAQTNYTWIGTSSSNWNDNRNWIPQGIPQSNDNVIINGEDGSLILDQNRIVNNITIQNIYFDFKGYALTVNGDASFSSTKITAGSLSITGPVNFNRVHIKATIKVISPSITIQNNMFDSTCYFENTGNSSDNVWRSNIFNNNASIVQNNPNTVWNIADGELPEVFNGDAYFTAKAGFLRVASTNFCIFRGSINVSSSGQGISIGDTSLSYLINNSQMDAVNPINTSGFTSGKLLLYKILQSGSGSNIFQLTGTASLSLSNCDFGGNVTISTAQTDTSKSAVSVYNSIFRQSTIINTSLANLQRNYFNISNNISAETKIIQTANSNENQIQTDNVISGAFVTKQ